MSKYGNLNGPTPPKFEADHAAIEDLLAKKILTPAQASRRHRNLKRASLMFIAVTNGGYRAKTKGLNKRVSLSAAKNAFVADKVREIVADQAAA